MCCCVCKGYMSENRRFDGVTMEQAKRLLGVAYSLSLNHSLTHSLALKLHPRHSLFISPCYW